MSKLPFFIRDVYWVLVDGVEESKERVSIVTRVESDRVEIVYGQGKSGHGREIVITPDSQAGRRFRLAKDTYFRLSNVALVTPVRFRNRIGVCPSGLYVEFEALAEEARREYSVVDMVENILAAPGRRSPSLP